MKWWRSREAEEMVGRRRRSVADVLLRWLSGAALVLALVHLLMGNWLEATMGAVASMALLWCAKED